MNWNLANPLELNIIAYFDNCPRWLKKAAKAELYKRKGRINPCKLSSLKYHLNSFRT
jgi:hypothetical protein